MENEKKTKQIKVIFVYSDELRIHHYGLVFNDEYNLPLPNISNANFNETQNFEVKNNEMTNIKLVTMPSSADPFLEFAQTDFPFNEDEIYYLQIVSGDSGLKFNITDYNPTAP